MFNKLFKYDFKSVFRFWWIFAVAAIVLSVMGGFLLDALFTITSQEEPDILLTILSMLGFFFSIMLLACFPLATIIMTLIRYYKNFFSDEGYLTFTLPVKRSQLLCSKLLSNFVFQIMSGAITLLGALIILGLGLRQHSAEFYQEFYTAFQPAGAHWNFVDTALLLSMLLSGIVGILYGCNMFYLCITIGSVISKKHKALTGIGIYLAFTAVSGTINQFVMSLFLVMEMENLSGATSTLLYFIVTSLLNGGFAALAYCVNLYLLKNKLNLS